MIYNNEFQSSGLLNSYNNYVKKEPVSDQEFYSDFLDVIFATVPFLLFMLCRHNTKKLVDQNYQQHQQKKVFKSRLNQFRRAFCVITRRSHIQPQVWILMTINVIHRTLSISAWPCLIVFVEQKYHLTEFVSMTTWYWFVRAVTVVVLIPLLN